MMAPGQDSSGAMKARLEFGLWRGAFKKSYSAWANAPHDLKPALLLRGASLARAESWLLAFPEKLSDGEKRFILRSISQSAATKTAGTAEPARPWLRARRFRGAGAGSFWLLVAVYAVAMWVFAPDFIQTAMEDVINGGLREADIAEIRKQNAEAAARSQEPGTDVAAAPAATPATGVAAPAGSMPAAAPAEPLPEPVAAPAVAAAPAGTPVPAGASAGQVDPAGIEHVRRLVGLSAHVAATGDRRVSVLLAVEAVHEAAKQPAGLEREAAARVAIAGLMSALTARVSIASRPGTVAAMTPPSALMCANGAGMLAALDRSTAEAWRTHEPRRVLAMERRLDPLRGAATDRDCQHFIVAGDDDAADVWSFATGQRLARLQAHAAGILASAFSPDRRLVLTASQDRTARLWDAGSGRPIAVLDGHDGAVTGAAFSADGRLVATASADRTARLWSIAGGRPVHALGGHLGAVTSVAFSPDGKQVLTTSSDGTARLWETATGETVGVLRPDGGSVTSARFDGSGRRVATIAHNAAVQLWDTAGGRLRFELGSRATPVRSVAFSPDDRWIATLSWDGDITIWDGESGRARSSLGERGQRIVAAAFADDGRSVRAFTAEGTLITWPLVGSAVEALTQARAVAPGCLSAGEREVAGLGPEQPAWCQAEAGAAIDLPWPGAAGAVPGRTLAGL